MSEYNSQVGRAQGSVESEAEGIGGWTVGFIVFAASMMILLGIFHAIAGFAGVLEDDFYVVREGYDLKIDVTTWGWIQLIGGGVVVLAGCYLLTGHLWARLTAILVVFVSMVWNFFSIPYYPVWSILMIALDIGILWAIIAHGGEYERFAREGAADESGSSRLY
jgi:hypothetical protein